MRVIAFKNINSVKDCILKSGLNYTQFASKIGISKATLDKAFSRGRASPHIARSICNGLNTEFDDFFLIKKCPNEHKA